MNANGREWTAGTETARGARGPVQRAKLMRLRPLEFAFIRVHSRFQHGFTLVELVLVIAIVGIVAAVTVPDFVQSMRGNRLRSAARSVAMAARYARSMALLNQKEMVVSFDKERGTVAVHEAGAAPDAPAPAADEADFTPAVPETPAPAGSGPSSVEHILRVLDQVKIEEVAVNRGDLGESPRPGADGGLIVRYHSNGTCDPYTVRLADERGSRVTIRVDRFSGVETERQP